MRRLLLAAGAALALFLSVPVQAADVGLIGLVSSAEEGTMEGVLVSVRKEGSPIRITVVTNAEGRYGFPVSKLEAGAYKIEIRATGYDLDGQGTAEVVTGKTAIADLRLKKTADLAAQLSNAEWIASMPNAPERRALAGCVNCHTVQRVIESAYSADDFMSLIPRMSRYGAMSRPHRPQMAADRQTTSAPRGDTLRKVAEYFASINRSGGKEHTLKTAPRPTGRATRVIMTEYELPRPEFTEPHDVVVDGEGTVWYSNFADQIIGQLDPKTGQVIEHPLPEFKKGAPTGSLDLELDPDGNPWVAMMYQAAVAKLDKKTGKVQAFPLPAEFDNPKVQIGMVDPHHSHVDGKIWFTEDGSRTFFRLDPVSGTVENVVPFRTTTGVHGAYGVASDANNDLWFMDFADRNIGRTDKTGSTLFYPVPTPASRPRRGHMTADGRLVFAEFAGDKVAIFDTKTEQVKEFPTPPLFAPYDAVLDKNDEIWTGGQNADRILRIDTKTGQSTAYLLPMQTNVRRVFVDNSTTPVTFWVGNNHHGNVIKLEQVD